MDGSLTLDERNLLLAIARQALGACVRDEPLPNLALNELPPRLRLPGASFVTLTRSGELRGCIGTLEAQEPLARDVQEHAVAAARNDYRFPPVSLAELPEIEIEISTLTPSCDLEYQTAQELVSRLRPGIDGVTLIDGWRRATFLPQVWQKLPDTELFLSYLCEKMGAAPDLWRAKKLRVQTYQVEEFHEGRRDSAGSHAGSGGCLDL